MTFPTHNLVNGKWQRSEGLLITEIEFKFPFTKNIASIKPNDCNLTLDYVINSSIKNFAAKFKYLLLNNSEFRAQPIKVLKAYDLIDIVFGQYGDISEFGNVETSISAISNLYRYGLVVVFLGVAEPSNKFLSDAIIQLFEGRAFEQKPTWMITSVPLTSLQLLSNYSSKVINILNKLTELKW